MYAERKWLDRTPAHRGQHYWFRWHVRCIYDPKTDHRLRAYKKHQKAQFYRHRREKTIHCTPADCQRVTRRILRRRGEGGQFGCLVALWNRESRWLRLAHNPSSGAHGIPQALPGSKMAAAGPDWYSNAVTQIEWGLDYIDDRYGSPCAADGFQAANNWY